MSDESAVMVDELEVKIQRAEEIAAQQPAQPELQAVAEIEEEKQDEEGQDEVQEETQDDSPMIEVTDYGTDWKFMSETEFKDLHWKRTLYVLEVPGGCILKSGVQRTDGEQMVVLESMIFVPGVKVHEATNSDGALLMRKLIAVQPGALIYDFAEHKKEATRRGRPKGKKKGVTKAKVVKPKAVKAKKPAKAVKAKKGPGRPKGSKNKKKGPGRPKGSKNKVKK